MAGHKTAFVFPGQGSQSVGMGRDLYERYPDAAAVFDRGDGLLGWSLSHLMFEGPVESLNETIHTQPAVYVMNHACFTLLSSMGEPFDFALGHSLGEYNALTAAGVIDFDTGLKAVERRAALMNEAATARPGKMLAVLGLDDETVTGLALDTLGVAVVANYNCPGQVVISGEVGAIDALADELLKAGAKKVVPLPVSGAFHSPLMAGAETAVNDILDSIEFKDARVPVCSNFTGLLSTDGAALKTTLQWQMTGAVQWTKSIQTVLEAGAERFVEAGPGRVLAGLIKRIAGSGIEITSVNSVETLEETINGGQYV